MGKRDCLGVYLLSGSCNIETDIVAHYLTDTSCVIKVFLDIDDDEPELLRVNFMFSHHFIFTGLIRDVESSSEFHTFTRELT